MKLNGSIVRLFLTLFLITFASIDSYADVYGTYGPIVYRADSANNIIWAKNFIGNIAPSPFGGNLVRECVFDGRYVYVQIVQISGSSPNPIYYKISIVVLDTNGTFLSSESRDESGFNTFELGIFFPSTSSGAWYSQRLSGGLTYSPSIIKVDSLGKIKFNFSAWFGSVSEIKSNITLKDSNYLLAANNYLSSSPGYTTSALVKFDDDGNIIWSYTYEVPITDYLDFKSCVEDDNGNIYAIGAYSSTTSGFHAFGLKVDSNGIPLIFRTWPALNNYSGIGQLSYRNNEVIELYSGYEIHFDSLFEDSCLASNTAQAIFSIVTPFPLSLDITDSTSFTPTDTTFILTPYTYIYPEYCAATSIATNPQINEINIFPSPVSNYLKLNWINHDLGRVNITIFDIEGRVVIDEKIISSEINVSSLNQGVYFLRINNSDESKTLRFIKID